MAEVAAVRPLCVVAADTEPCMVSQKLTDALALTHRALSIARWRRAPKWPLLGRTGHGQNGFEATTDSEGWHACGRDAPTWSQRNLVLASCGRPVLLLACRILGSMTSTQTSRTRHREAPTHQNGQQITCPTPSVRVIRPHLHICTLLNMLIIESLLLQMTASPKATTSRRWAAAATRVMSPC